MGVIQIPITDLLIGLIPFIASFLWYSMRQDSRIKALEIRQDQDDKIFARVEKDVSEIKEMLHELKERFARLDAIQDVKKKLEQ